MYGESTVEGSREKWVSRWQMVTGSNLKGVQKRGAGFVKTPQVEEKQKKKNA